MQQLVVLQMRCSDVKPLWEWKREDAVQLNQSLKISHQCDHANAPLPLLLLITCRSRHPALFRELDIYKLSTGHSTAALLQTGTSILTLHSHLLSARYLSGLFRWALSVTEQNDWTVSNAAQWWWLREGKPGHCWVVRRDIYFWLPKIQCISSKWTKRFFEAHNLPRWFFVFELLEESFQP